MRFWARLLLLSILPTAGWAQSSFPPCPSDTRVLWHKCFGTFTGTDGERYVGEWQDDKFHGQGVYTFPSGERYVGEFRDGRRNGQGTWTHPNGERYVGEYRDGKRDGLGTWTNSSGHRYVGEFRGGNLHGQGTYTYPGGGMYVGEYRDGKQNGRGAYTWPDGDKYVGDFRDNERNGQGIEYRADGTIKLSGSWVDGKLVQPFALDRSRFPFGRTAQAAASPVDPTRAERDRLAAEAAAARQRQRELEAQLDAERRRRADAESSGQRQARSTGTGFSVATGFIVTNQHVVAGCQRLEVLSNDGRRFARVVDSDELVDLALLRVTGLGGGVAPIRRAGSVRLGEQAYVFGFPLTGLLSESGNFTGGTVSSLRGIRDSANHIQISTPVQPGNSGGALVDASGAVIGVVVGKLNASAVARATGDIPQNVNFAVSLQALADFLGKNKVPVSTVERSAALDTAQLADVMRGFTHRIECLDSPEAATRPAPASPTSPASASTALAACSAAASEVNRTTPRIIDQATTLMNANCTQVSGTVHLQYRNRLIAPAGSIDQAKLDSERPRMVASWCTDPTLKPLLNMVNVEYHYSDGAGRYIGKVEFGRTDCR